MNYQKVGADHSWRWLVWDHGDRTVLCTAECLGAGYWISHRSPDGNIFVIYSVPTIPKYRFEKNISIPCFQYARGMFGLPYIVFHICSNGYLCCRQAFIQKTELGLYSIVVTLAQAPAVIIYIIGQSDPDAGFSQKQNDKQWINIAIIKAIPKIIMTIGMPLVLLPHFTEEIFSPSFMVLHMLLWQFHLSCI